FFAVFFFPFLRSRAACFRVSFDPFLGGFNFTPARRAFERPMAIACLVDRAPCLPSRTCSISSRTNSPAWVLGAFPSFLSSSARSKVSFSGIDLLLRRKSIAQAMAPPSRVLKLSPTFLAPLRHGAGCGLVRFPSVTPMDSRQHGCEIVMRDVYGLRFDFLTPQRARSSKLSMLVLTVLDSTNLANWAGTTRLRFHPGL